MTAPQGPVRRASAAVAATVGALSLAVAASLLVAPSAGAAVSAGVTPAATTTPSPTPTPTPTPPPKPVPLPAVGVSVTFTPRQSALVGVAYPITATFTSPINFYTRVEQNMKVYVNGRLAAGAWYWKSRTVAVFRPRLYWPGHALIVIRSSLARQVIATTKTHRYVGRVSTTKVQGFRTGRAMISFVSATSHRMRVYSDGRLIRVMKVSLGKPGFETRSGIKAVMDKYLERRMTSTEALITDPNDQYDVIATFAVRLTPSGEFVHGASWATSRIGVRNGSHGCTNLFDSDAKWFYYHVLPGDPVVTTGTSRKMEPWNGTGAPWNIPWSTWLLHSATKGQKA
jgi:lipoprotein-anchoring transpeptidase ErfK/SrfK